MKTIEFNEISTPPKIEGVYNNGNRNPEQGNFLGEEVRKLNERDKDEDRGILPHEDFSLDYAKEEKGSLHRKFIEEIEKECIELAPSLVFKKRNPREKEETFGKVEIETRLERGPLNIQQKKAVKLSDKSLIINALAGTGKCLKPNSRVLVDNQLVKIEDIWEKAKENQEEI